MYDFQTLTHGFRRMEWSEIRDLEIGDKISICINWDPPRRAEFIDAIVTRTVFWNSDADQPEWEVETNNGFVDTYSIYEVVEF